MGRTGSHMKRQCFVISDALEVISLRSGKVYRSEMVFCVCYKLLHFLSFICGSIMLTNIYTRGEQQQKFVSLSLFFSWFV
ncbi:hypothetical protein BCR43DRAFT_495951 [Syncephalastrum racemosum]|uniref:Uncharacterized protein n=1 Tax=Syncephalastrum racemosum TaxID=13706 RepID=A0A1X2H6Q0_SYNRA|nr:hypothetical protein BCR43DRAFT_495951 [Syncephalastrum racemosum]